MSPALPYSLESDDVAQVLSSFGILHSVDEHDKNVFTISIEHDEEGTMESRKATFDDSSGSWRLSPTAPKAVSPSIDDVYGDPKRMLKRYTSSRSSLPGFGSGDDPSSTGSREFGSNGFQSPPKGGCLNMKGNWTDMLSPRTDHIAFFLDTNWTSTSLGSLTDWPMSLKLMTSKLFADPRPACIYW